MIIRTLGFDIKKFNFSNDFRELELTHEDNEEVELNINLDASSLLRATRKKKRELGYFYKEYRVIILGIFAIIIVSVGFFTYNNLKDKLKIYHYGEIFGRINYMTISDGYYKIDNEKNYIVIKFDVFKYGIKERLNVNNMILSINNEEYLPNKNICYKFDSIGNCYKKQYINDNSSSYILVYDVDVLNLDKVYLIYKESYDNVYKVKLNLQNYE